MGKNNRQLNIFLNFLDNSQFSFDYLLNKYNISERTLYRDLEEIRDTLEDMNIGTLISNRKNSTYHLKLENNQHLNLAEIVSISKILLHSRAFSKKEMSKLIISLQSGLKEKQKKICHDIIKDELTFYQPLTHNKELIPLISNFITYINNRNTIHFYYKRSDNQVTSRENQPVSLFFSDFYFYAMFYSENNNKHVPYRLDRFLDNITITKKNKIKPNIQLNESSYKNKTYQMFSSGKEVKAVFNYWGNDAVVLDYFPNTTIEKPKQYKQDFSRIQTSVYDTGFIMWALSQGDSIEILEPLSLVNKMKEKILSMNQIYKQS